MQTRFRRANQHKKANKQIMKLKKYLQNLIIDVKRKVPAELLANDDFQRLFEFADVILGQSRFSKNKLYSIHEPDVECIGKGKAHKKYEFGNKVGVVTTSKKCFILSALAFHGNPYDGHTIAENLEHSRSIIDGLGEIKMACVDQGYGKYEYKVDDITVHIVKRGWHKVERTLRKWLSRRSAIEPVIGHMKSDCRLDRNYLKGKEGDRVNAILCACGYNMRKLLVHIFCLISENCSILHFIAKFVSNMHLDKFEFCFE